MLPATPLPLFLVLLGNEATVRNSKKIISIMIAQISVFLPNLFHDGKALDHLFQLAYHIAVHGAL